MTELSAYSLEPARHDVYGFDLQSGRRRFGGLEPCRLRLQGRGGELIVNLKPFSWQDIRYLQNRVKSDIPLREASGVLVSSSVIVPRRAVQPGRSGGC